MTRRIDLTDDEIVLLVDKVTAKRITLRRPGGTNVCLFGRDGVSVAERGGSIVDVEAIVAAWQAASKTVV